VTEWSPASDATFFNQFIEQPTDSLLFEQYAPVIPEFNNMTHNKANGVIFDMLGGTVDSRPDTKDITARYTAKFTHRGHEVQTFGDSFMIAFPSVRRAVLCAIAVRRAFAAYCESHPDVPIRVRIGLHVGEAVRESTDFFGKAVILAARVSSLAQGGQILVSSTLHDVAVSAGDLRFAPAGERPLKGLAGTHRLYELIW
jgi:Adenylate and Guanylate cyclase catalytic domain